MAEFMDEYASKSAQMLLSAADYVIDNPNNVTACNVAMNIFSGMAELHQIAIELLEHKGEDLAGRQCQEVARMAWSDAFERLLSSYSEHRTFFEDAVRTRRRRENKRIEVEAVNTHSQLSSEKRRSECVQPEATPDSMSRTGPFKRKPLSREQVMLARLAVVGSNGYFRYVPSSVERL